MVSRPRVVATGMDEFKGLPLGRILLKMGVVTRAQVQEAIGLQQNTREPIGQLLIRLGHATETDVRQALAAQAGREPN